MPETPDFHRLLVCNEENSKWIRDTLLAARKQAYDAGDAETRRRLRTRDIIKDAKLNGTSEPGTPQKDATKALVQAIDRLGKANKRTLSEEDHRKLVTYLFTAGIASGTMRFTHATRDDPDDIKFFEYWKTFFDVKIGKQQNLAKHAVGTYKCWCPSTYIDAMFVHGLVRITKPSTKSATNALSIEEIHRSASEDVSDHFIGFMILVDEAIYGISRDLGTGSYRILMLTENRRQGTSGKNAAVRADERQYVNMGGVAMGHSGKSNYVVPIYLERINDTEDAIATVEKSIGFVPLKTVPKAVVKRIEKATAEMDRSLTVIKSLKLLNPD